MLSFCLSDRLSERLDWDPTSDSKARFNFFKLSKDQNCHFIGNCHFLPDVWVQIPIIFNCLNHKVHPEIWPATVHTRIKNPQLSNLNSLVTTTHA